LNFLDILISGYMDQIEASHISHILICGLTKYFWGVNYPFKEAFPNSGSNIFESSFVLASLQQRFTTMWAEPFNYLQKNVVCNIPKPTSLHQDETRYCFHSNYSFLQ